MSAPEPWQRRYADGNSEGGAIVWLIIGTMAFLLGSLLVLIGLVGWLVGHAPEMAVLALFGGLFALLALITPFVAHTMYQRAEWRTIVCGPEGFRVVTTNRKTGQREEKYAWQEITATKYDEYEAHSAINDRRSTVQCFSVETVRGQAFVATRSFPQFNDLIHLFNQMTSQLPYIWTPQLGYSVPGITRRLAYIQAPRPAN